MPLLDLLHPVFPFRPAVAAGLLVALVGALVVTPKALRKLRGAGITGVDRHKPGRPKIPEMGGLAVFLAFNVGTFTVIWLAPLLPSEKNLVLASLVVGAGACITGVLDDLITLRQRFKAFIPLAFAAPLSLFVTDTTIRFPLLSSVDFSLLYPLALVPLGIACASNGFNMLEGFNGLGAGLGIILAAALSAIVLISSATLTGLALLIPLVGALGGFLYYNMYPARVFPGDTMTLFVGSILASAAILSKVEFWGALLFLPHVVEFFLKSRAGFQAQSFATSLSRGKLVYGGPVRSLTHIPMKKGRVSEVQLVVVIWTLEALYAMGVIALFLATKYGFPL